MTTPPVRIGARPSPLSTAQTRQIAALLEARGVPTEFVPVTTDGDTDRRHLTEIGGTGVFAQALRARLAAGDVDLAVHSAKDLPTAPAPGLVVAAHPTREEVADVLVGRRLDEVGTRLRVGTGSPRRAVQLRAWATAHQVQLEIVAIRGNVGRRLDLVRTGEVGAVVLALAGLRRLGLVTEGSPSEIDRLPSQVLPDDVMVPAPAQGALALEVAESNQRIVNLVRELDDPLTTACVTAERALLARMEAGCLAPVGAVARPVTPCGNGPDLTMAAVIGRTIGGQVDRDREAPGELIRIHGDGSRSQAAALGAGLADQLLARLGVTSLAEGRQSSGPPGTN